MRLPDLAEIEQHVRMLAAQIGAPERALPTFGCSQDGARPHIEANPQGLHYVVVERGEELQQITTHEVDELLAEHPFDDRADERAKLAVALRQSGSSDEAAWKDACQKYPLPAPD